MVNGVATRFATRRAERPPNPEARPGGHPSLAERHLSVAVPGASRPCLQGAVVWRSVSSSPVGRLVKQARVGYPMEGDSCQGHMGRSLLSHGFSLMTALVPLGWAISSQEGQ
jgi:hypothetical protein